AELIGHVLYAARHSGRFIWQQRDASSFEEFSIFTGSKYLPSSQILLDHRYPTKTLGIDSSGFIHNGVEEEVQSAAHLIFLLGGSTVEGRGASSNSHTIAAYLEQQLRNAYGNRSVRVINAGHSGDIAAQQFLRLYGDILSRYKPSTIIELDGRNDAYNFLSFAEHGWQANWVPYFTEISSEVNALMTGSLQFRKLVNFYLGRYSILHALVGRAIASGSHPYRHPQQMLPSKEQFRLAVKAYQNNHLLSEKIAQLSDAKHLTFLQPVLLARLKAITREEQQMMDEWNTLYSSPFYWEGLDIFYAMAQEQLRAHEAEGRFDISAVFQDSNEKVYIDSCHYTDTGNELIARAIADRLKPLFREFSPGKSSPVN
ncbi:MAG: SGNH/GDSL hydrolase family protein, partial [Bdellovibrionales bacterium]|nr:SGNH/GDSL hydrolase family protein [Bdellovibrionales bacterium]